MLIRLEMHSAYDKTRYGIYQIVDPYILYEYCAETNLLPVPEFNEIQETDELFSYWFTHKGWQKYGKGFVNLLYEPDGILELENNETPIYVSIISTKKESTLFSIYQDKWQKALLVSDAEKVSETFEVYNSLDWEKLEQQFPELV